MSLNAKTGTTSPACGCSRCTPQWHPKSSKNQTEIQQNYKTHRAHAPKIKGRVFSEGSEAPQAAQHTRTLLGDPKTDTKTPTCIKNLYRSVKHIGCMLQSFRGLFFLRVLKRRRQRNKHAPCWETLKSAKRFRTLLLHPGGFG